MAKAASRSQPAPSGTSVTGIVSHPWVLRVVLAGLVMGAIAVGLLKLDSLSRRTQLQRAIESDRARADLVPLFVIPNASKVAAVVPADHALRIRIESRDPAKLAARLGVAPPATGATGLDVELLPNPQPPAGDAGRTS